MEDNTSAKFEFLASFILPNGILDWFDFVKANEEPVEKKDCIYKSTPEEGEPEFKVSYPRKTSSRKTEAIF